MKTPVFLLTIVTVIFLFLLLSTRLELGLVRYFDADELAYLHWAHNVFVGKLPYIDFFFYVPTGFLWFLAPMYWFVNDTAILSVSRVVAFVIFVLLGMVSGLVLKQIRKPTSTTESWWIALLPASVLTFLPLPADKLLEIRPDNIATVFAFVGMYLQIRWFESQNKLHASWSGVAYGVSLLLLPKSLPQVMIAVVIALLASCSSSKIRARFSVFILGIGLPLGVFGAWILFSSRSVSDVGLILYSLTKLPLEVNKIGQLFPMQPDLFFYPNNNYYGIGGWSSGLIFNHVIWVVGLLFGTWRFITPWIGGKNKTGAWIELLVGGSFFAYVVTFIYGYPLRHAQYLIPIAVFVSVFVGDLIWSMWITLGTQRWRQNLFVCGYMMCMVLLWIVSESVNGPKRLWTNAEDVRTLRFAIQTIPKDSYVLDLIGATIYFRDPAYGCCLPLGQYSPFLSRQVNILSDGLVQANPRYIYQGRLYRINDVAERDQRYIEDHYQPLTTDKTWLVRK